MSLNKVRKRCEAMPTQLSKGPSFALYSIMDFIVDNYMPVVEGLQSRFDALEEAIFQQRPSRQTLEGLYELKRELLRLHAAISPLIDICNELMRFHDSVDQQGCPGLFSRYCRPYQAHRSIHRRHPRDADSGDAGASIL